MRNPFRQLFKRFRFNREALLVMSLALFFLGSVWMSVQRQASYQKAHWSGDLSLINANTKKESVLVLPLYGVIQVADEGFLGEKGTSLVNSGLRAAEKDEFVKAVVLRVNSPGGTVASSQELFQEIEAFKKRTGKPVVVSIVDYGASGAYWVSLAADHIFALPGSLVGSMGVITQVPDLTQVPERYGIDVNTYKAGEMKDMMNPWRKSSRAERDIINQMLENIHGQFIDVLVKKRDMTLDDATVLADGRIYTGEQALELGLIDGLGGLNEAVHQAAALAGLKSKPKVIWKSQRNLEALFSQFRSSVFSVPNQFLSGGIQPVY